MRAAAALALALALAGAADAAAQESRFRLNPYAGWYHYDESSFEKAYQDPEDFGGASIDICFEDDALHNIELTGGVEIPL